MRLTSELVTSSTEDGGEVEGVPAAESIEVALSVGVSGKTLSIHALCMNQFVILEDHIFISK